MEDFGYKKNDKIKHDSFPAKKIFLISATLFSISTFVFISIEAYKVINKDSQKIEIIKSPTQPIKIYEENDLRKNNEKIVNRSIYDDIFGNRKEIIREDIKINKNPEPALPSNNFNRESEKFDENFSDPENKDIDDINENFSKKTDKESNTENLETNSKTSNSLNNQSTTENNINNQQTKPSKKRRSIRVQISAMSSKQGCEDYFNQLNRFYPGVFNKTKFYIEKADLGVRGIFYRLQIGNFYDQIDAEEFCNRFISQTKKSRSECIIVE